MGGLRLGPGGCSSIAQSLPSHSHMAMHAAPRKPRVHPSPAPSFAGVPLMALRRVEYVCPPSSPRPPHRPLQCASLQRPSLLGHMRHRALVREHTLHAARAQCTRSVHAVHTQPMCISSAHTEYMQCTCREHAVHNSAHASNMHMHLHMQRHSHAHAHAEYMHMRSTCNMHMHMQSTCTCTCRVHAHAHAHAHEHAHTHTHAHAHAHAHTHTHAHAHAHAHTHTHAHAHAEYMPCT